MTSAMMVLVVSVLYMQSGVVLCPSLGTLRSGDAEPADACIQSGAYPGRWGKAQSLNSLNRESPREAPREGPRGATAGGQGSHSQPSSFFDTSHLSFPTYTR